MNGSTPEQILKQASEAAAAIIPALEAERTTLMANLQELDFKISQLRSLVSAYPIEAVANVSTASLEESKPLQESMFEDAQTRHSNKAPRGQLNQHIATVLSPVTPMSAKQIKDALESSFKIDYNRSSIHQTLQRGLKSGKFSCSNNLWLLNL